MHLRILLSHNEPDIDDPCCPDSKVHHDFSSLYRKTFQNAEKEVIRGYMTNTGIIIAVVIFNNWNKHICSEGSTLRQKKSRLRSRDWIRDWRDSELFSFPICIWQASTDYKKRLEKVIRESKQLTSLI